MMNDNLVTETNIFKIYKKKPGHDGSVYGKTNLFKLKESIGVYFIYDREDGQPIYIGYSIRNLYKAILRKFETWNDSNQFRFDYKNDLINGRSFYVSAIIFNEKSNNSFMEICALLNYFYRKFNPKNRKTGLSIADNEGELIASALERLSLSEKIIIQ